MLGLVSENAEEKLGLAMTLRVIIADDEPLGRARLRQLLEREPAIEIVAECADGAETVEAIQRASADLVFLDVKMPRLDGFEVLGALRGRLPAVVFVTAHDEFALRAFEARAVDYLLKPVDSGRLQKALQRVRTSLRAHQTDHTVELLRGLMEDYRAKPSSPTRLTVKSAKGVLLINVDDVDWIRGADNYAELHVGKKVHLLRKTLNALEEQLPRNGFTRISRSLIVNADRIVELFPKTHGDYTVVLRDGTRLTGSRKHREDLLRLLDKQQ